MIRLILILASLAAIGWWSVQNDDDTPRGAPRERGAVGELSTPPRHLGLFARALDTRRIDGSNWNNVIADQTMRTLWLKNSVEDGRKKQVSAAIAGLIGINPNDELEGMIAAQLVACHNASMECYRRAMQTF